jgi:hypothetical protein
MASKEIQPGTLCTWENKNDQIHREMPKNKQKSRKLLIE